MGYRSDIAIIVAAKTAAQADELMAIYALNPLVQETGGAKEWCRHDREGAVLFLFEKRGVKWYDDYDDVKAIEALMTLCETFAEERGAAASGEEPMFPYAWRKIRIGEENGDIEELENSNDNDLEGFLWDCLGVSRSIDVNI